MRKRVSQMARMLLYFMKGHNLKLILRLILPRAQPECIFDGKLLIVNIADGGGQCEEPGRVEVETRCSQDDGL